MAHQLGSTNFWDLGIGLSVLALVLGTELISHRIPGALIGLVSATVLVALTGVGVVDVAILGSVHAGLPHPDLGSMTFTQAVSLFPLAAAVALVCLSQTVATIRAYPGGWRDSINRDFLGLGASNVLAGLVGTFPVNTSPARTAVATQARGKTQMVGLLAAFGVVLLVPFANILHNIPLCALAGVLIWVALRIFRYRDLRVILRYDRWEFALAFTALVIVSFVGVEIGILVALGLAIVDRARRTARPRTYVMGRVPGTTSWTPMGLGLEAEEVDGVVVFLFAAPLYFANASTFTGLAMEAVEQMTPAADGSRLFVLDAAPMSDIDFTGIQAFRSLVDLLEEEEIVLTVARAQGAGPKNLADSGLADRIGSDHMFGTVDEAVVAFGPESRDLEA